MADVAAGRKGFNEFGIDKDAQTKSAVRRGPGMLRWNVSAIVSENGPAPDVSESMEWTRNLKARPHLRGDL